jgi:aspartate-semialdehyde dehydrogenase
MKVGIVGATGAVGQEIISVLHSREFPVSELHLYASARSAGSTLSTPLGEHIIQPFSLSAVSEMDILFLAVSGSFALEFAPQIAVPGGPLVIDNSSAFRLLEGVPLVIPEINGHLVAPEIRLIANPNCTTAIAAMALWPLHCAFGLNKVIISTYQAASGAGIEVYLSLSTAFPLL